MWYRLWTSLFLALVLAGCAGSVVQRDREADASDARQTDFGRATAWLENGRYQEAATALQRLTEQQPDVAAPWINLGIAYLELGQDEEGVAALERGLQLAPGHPVASNRLAIQHRRNGRFEEARALYQAALRQAPDHAMVHLNLGILCDLYLHEPRCALEHYERYQTLAGEDEEVAMWLLELRRRVPEGNQ